MLSAPPRSRYLLACSIMALAVAMPAQASPDFTTNNYGSAGLVDLPSADMAPDGHLVAGASYMLDIQHYNVGFQLLPWLETSFRYSGIRKFDPSFPVYWDRSFAVKARLFQEGDWMPAVAVGINDLVGTGVYSSEYVVATKSLGPVQATIGMGWGRLADADPMRNPLSLISKSFDTRATGFTGQGGEFSLSKYFHGPAGLFGGLAWQTPIENLTLKAEYSSDSYALESSKGSFTPENQFNFGASYRAFGNVLLGLNWMYGRSIGASVAFDLNPTQNPYPDKMGPQAIAPNIRTVEEQTLAVRAARRGSIPQVRSVGGSVDTLWTTLPGVSDVEIKGATLSITAAAISEDLCTRAAAAINAATLHITTVALRSGARTINCAATNRPFADPQAAVYQLPGNGTGTSVSAPAQPMVIQAAGRTAQDLSRAATKIRADMASQNIGAISVKFGAGSLTIHYTNQRYQVEADAVDRLLRVAMQDAPPEIEDFHFVAVAGGLPVAQYDILRSAAERNFTYESGYDILANGSGPLPATMANRIPASAIRSLYPRFSWTIYPQLRQAFFDPTNPLGLQLVVDADAQVELLPGLTLSAEVESSVWDSVSKGRISDSLLPHVRTDTLQYLIHGGNGIPILRAEYRFKLSPTVYAAVRGGYLESMFAGVGGEILWRPEGQRWALGADLYEVKQRAYDRLFGFLPYQKMTGHITLYYDSPWYGLNFQLRAGQYLAGDRGVSLQVARRFSTGVEVGVFATKTNVSSIQFGEGSFDKGFFLRIPLDWALPIETQSFLTQILRPVQRDGGQELIGDANLFGITRRTSLGDAYLLGRQSGAAW